jgi:hypothetical protein
MAALNYSMPCVEGNQVSPPHFSLLPRQGQRKSTGQLPPLFPHIHVFSFRLKPAHPFLTRNPLNFLSSSGSAHSVLVSALIFPANVATALAGSCSRLVEKISVFTAQLQFAGFFNISCVFDIPAARYSILPGLFYEKFLPLYRTEHARDTDA